MLGWSSVKTLQDKEIACATKRLASILEICTKNSSIQQESGQNNKTTLSVRTLCNLTNPYPTIWPDLLFSDTSRLWKRYELSKRIREKKVAWRLWHNADKFCLQMFELPWPWVHSVQILLKHSAKHQLNMMIQLVSGTC